MELEIKLVARAGEPLEPAAVLEELGRLAPAVGRTRRLDLDAIYHDRPDGLLRRARWLLRCRAEGPAWVATVKGPGLLVDGVRGRIEIEAPLERAAEPGDPLPEALAATLAEAGLALDRWPPRTFRSIVRRVASEVVLPGGTRAELAIDHGEVQAGGRSSPVHELELELLDGSPRHLVEATLHLSHRFDVRPGVRTKSGRGLLLLDLLPPPTLPPPDASLPQIWEAFAELEERRIEGGDARPEEHDRLARELGIAPGHDAPGWTTAVWSAFARAVRG